MTNIILSGGYGTRLWSLSRKLEPKQFYKLIGNHSLFQETILRNKSYCEKQLIDHFIVSNLLTSIYDKI